jgi:hypothetical protein
MNIFQVLSQGKSRLHEPSMSAMLGYLLDSSEDHGLGDAFVRVFLAQLGPEIFSEVLRNKFINARTELEVAYQLDGARKDIDIELTLLDSDDTELYRIIIENKIKAGAANPKQLRDYYQAVLQDDPNIQKLMMVFLTPESKTSALIAEYDNLTVNNGHRKTWLFWHSESQDGLVALLRKVLLAESNGEINPINEYLRHTLKAFIRHAIQAFSPSAMQGSRVGEDIGEIQAEQLIELNDGSQYRVVLRDSTQIQVFNVKSGEKEVARRIMAQYIDEHQLPIKHQSFNTRTIGKMLFKCNFKSI